MGADGLGDGMYGVIVDCGVPVPTGTGAVSVGLDSGVPETGKAGRAGAPAQLGKELATILLI